MIRIDNCISCNNRSIGTTSVKDAGESVHRCDRCYPEHIAAVAELQKEMWLNGADLETIKLAQ